LSLLFPSNHTFLTFSIDVGSDVEACGGDNADRLGDTDLSRLACFRRGGDGDFLRSGVDGPGVVSSSPSDAVDSTNSRDLN